MQHLQKTQNEADASRDSPIFILTTSRSGSTLLRYLLNVHPDIYAPAETNLLATLQQLLFTVNVAFEAENNMDRIPAIFEPLCRDIAQASLGRAAAEHNAKRWCDKSLVNVDGLPVLSRVFPEAQFICLYRNCKDFLKSALDATTFGVHGYGFDPYIRDTPTNTILALSRYWLEKTEAALHYEEHELQGRVLRITYEALVADPTQVLRGLCSYLEISWNPSIFSEEQVFRNIEVTGPGDYKIAYTQHVSDSSVGSGRHIPLQQHVPPQMEEVSNWLGYALEFDAQSHLHAVALDPRVTRQAEAIKAVSAALVRQARPSGVIQAWPPVSLQMTNGARNTIDYALGTIRAGGELTPLTIYAEADDLLAITEGALNAGAAIRQGRINIRYNGDPVSDNEQYRSLHRFLLMLSGASLHD
jgi:hypothetical protein